MGVNLVIGLCYADNMNFCRQKATGTAIMRISFYLLFLATFFCWPAPGSAQTDTEVTLLSRIDFAPNLLDMISFDLQQQTGKHFSMIVQPVNASFPADLQGFLLVEEGIDPAKLPDNYEKTGSKVKLVWGLAVNKSIAHLFKNRTPDLETFGKVLQELKKNDRARFPWFESLLSNNTLRNFCMLFGEKAGRASPELPFWEQPCAPSLLYKAIEDELLNPFSVEADLSLAMEVFAAGDAMFVSHWVPECAFSEAGVDLPMLKNAIFIPFPLPRSSGKLPVIELQLMKPQTTAFIASSTRNSANQAIVGELLPLNFASESSWIDKHAAQNYDALIVGDL